MNQAELIEKYGTQPCLEHGVWREWSKRGFFELTSLNNLHVLPVLWDPVAGLALVETLDDRCLLVRVENLRKYSSIVRKTFIDRPRSAKKKPSEAKLDNTQIFAELLAELGIEKP